MSLMYLTLEEEFYNIPPFLQFKVALYVIFCCNDYKHNVLYFMSLLGQVYHGMGESICWV